ncbi:hypothetical protein J4402_04355 [Candidatus Pacearchaeota archaeon]|nr:hypothetical protein [Candidatus Pacearchaeota archaeon]
MKPIKNVIFWVASTLFSLVIIDLGIVVINEEKYIGIITALIGVALLFFAYYSFQIKINEERIKELKEWAESREELLNTLKDIVILKRVSKIR